MVGINVEQELTNELGFFGRCSWNDGKKTKLGILLKLTEFKV